MIKQIQVLINPLPFWLTSISVSAFDIVSTSQFHLPALGNWNWDSRNRDSPDGTRTYRTLL